MDTSLGRRAISCFSSYSHIKAARMENKPKFRPNPKAKLLDQTREVLRYHHYAYRTEQAYCQWILRYIHYFGGQTHPNTMGARHIEQFLSHLATDGKVSASTQQQALNALVFLYREVMDQPLDGQIAPMRSKRLPRPPTVLVKDEVRRLFSRMQGKHLLMARLLYGAGLRLMECIRLRVKDVDFGQNLIFVRGGKGGKDRTTILPQNIRDELRHQVEAVKRLHHKDLEEGFGEVNLPDALSRKYPKRGQGDRLAVGVLGPGALRRPPLRQDHGHHVFGARPAEGGETGRPGRRHRQTGRLPYPAPQLRHPHAGERHQYPRPPGAIGPRRCQDHRDLHPCHGPRCPSAAKPARPIVMASPKGRSPASPSNSRGD